MEERIRQRERGERGYGGRNEEDPLGGRGRSGTPWRRGEGQNATTDQPHEPGTHPPPDQPQEAAPTTSTSHKTHSHRPHRNLPKTTHPKTHHNHPKTTPPKQTTPQKTKKVYPPPGSKRRIREEKGREGRGEEKREGREGEKKRGERKGEKRGGEKERERKGKGEKRRRHEEKEKGVPTTRLELMTLREARTRCRSVRAWWWVHLFGFLWCGLFWGCCFGVVAVCFGVGCLG